MILPKKRYIYAIHTGRFAGEMWIYCKSTKETHGFLVIPIMENRYIEKNIFENGIKGNIVREIEILPRKVYKTSIKQFKHNEKALNN